MKNINYFVWGFIVTFLFIFTALLLALVYVFLRLTNLLEPLFILFLILIVVSACVITIWAIGKESWRWLE